MNTPPPCVGKSELFDSTDDFDHLRARVICAGCPFVQECILQAVEVAKVNASWAAVRGPDGTWGGLLWRNGKVREFVSTHAAVAA